MARTPASSDLGEDDLTIDDEEEDEPKRPPRHPRPTNVQRTRPRPIRGWRASGSKGEPPADRETKGYYRTGKRGKPSSTWRARDSLYFAPLVALAIIIILLVGVYGYAQNWPPVYVVESSSMQHGGSEQLGLINAGDLVLAQKIPVSQVVTYMVGMGRAYSTYGEYGDVILYSPNGQSGTPVIHRPLVYLDWNATSATFSIPELQGLACGSSPNATWSTSGTLGGCAWNNLPNGTVLNLYGVGWQSAIVSVTLGSATSGAHSGFLTMGDNNLDCSASPCRGEPDQSPAAISQIVEPGWVIGVARGMLPWVGSVKLLIDGNAGSVAPQSWQYLGITIAVLVGAAFALHYARRYVRPMDPRRAAEQEARDDAAEEEESEDRKKHFWSRLSFRHPPQDAEEDIDGAAIGRKRKGGGRPTPTVRRPPRTQPPRQKHERL
ncbi:MAG: hypothetical protein WAN74_03240 [Thermoplasmata archaeon]